MSPPRIDPITGQPFNWLAYVPLAVLLLTAAGFYGSLTRADGQQEFRIGALEVRVDTFEEGAQGREGRIRLLEQAVASMQTEVGYISQGVSRIERNLGTQP